MINKELDEEEAELRSIRQNEIDTCKNAIAEEEAAQADAAAWKDIIAAKKEAVSLQLESVYRSRLLEAHQQVRSLQELRLNSYVLVSNRSRSVSTTSWRLLMSSGGWNRSTWWTGLSLTSRSPSLQLRYSAV